jgi:hypothetical protein
MSGILQGIGQIKEGQIAAAQGDFAKKVAIRNQQALNRQAKAERDAAAIEEGRIARKSKLVQARLTAGGAKSGISLAGASLESLTDAAFQFSMDRNLTLRRGLLKSRGLIQRGKIIASQGRFAKTVGRAKRTAAFIKAAGSFASTFDGGPSGGSTSFNPNPQNTFSSSSGNTGLSKNFTSSDF